MRGMWVPFSKYHAMNLNQFKPWVHDVALAISLYTDYFK